MLRRYLALLRHALKGLSVFFDVHEFSAVFVPLDPLIGLRVVYLTAITDSTVPMSVAFRRVGRHFFDLHLCETAQLHPLVDPHVSHLRQVPFRTIVKLWHSEQETPS